MSTQIVVNCFAAAVPVSSGWTAITVHWFSGAVLELIDHDHVELLELIEAGDAEGAAQSMADHLTRLNAIFTYSEDTGKD